MPASDNIVSLNSLNLRGASILFILTFVLALSPARADIQGTPIDSLPVAEKVALREGQPYLTEISEGSYVARIVVRAPLEKVWEVITDYNAYQEFLPNVTSSQIVAVDGNQKTLEQISVARVLLFNIEARTLSLIEENSNMQRLDFRLLEGDLEVSQGSWVLEPYALEWGAPMDRILLTYSIEIDPGKTFSRAIFYKVFEEAIPNTLSAISAEISRRSENSVEIQTQPMN
ncbi:MAG: SRPBCC family protein [Cyanobacteria bacterium P01_H01_bin.15]